MSMAEIDPAAIRRQLERILVSDQLAKSETGRKLATYLVERSIRNDVPKEIEIAMDVFGKDASFSSAEDAVVRVGVRTLRQKLAEYYSGPGQSDELHFVIPKGAYRLVVIPRAQAVSSAVAAASSGTAAVPATPRRWRWAVGVASLLLGASLATNAYLLRHHASNAVAAATSAAAVRASPVWADVVAGSRPLTIVLGDLFMFTQVDPQTGRTLYVRDKAINSTEELHDFIAKNPAFADRGRLSFGVVQDSTAISLASILRIVDRVERTITIKMAEDLQIEDVRNNDVIYIGPPMRLGLLSGYYQLRSRYRYEPADSGVIDVVSQRHFLPEGTLSGQRIDYALAAKFYGPSGNHIMIFTSGARNVGLRQIVRTLTSPAGLAVFERRLREKRAVAADSFEALLSITGFRRTDLMAEVVDVNPFGIARAPASLTRAAN
jgi:hypothetical protein